MKVLFFLQSVTLQLFRTPNLIGPLWVVALQIFGQVPLLTLFVHCFPNQSHKVFQEMQGHLFLKFLLMATSPGWGGGGYSWEFLVGCATWFFKSDFRPKNVIFHTRFQTRTIKFIPIFRPGLKAEIMLSLLRLECKQKKFFESNWNSHTVPSFLLIWN